MKKIVRKLYLKRTLKNKKGFTLLEVVLATALVSILFTMAAFVIPTWYKAYAQTVRLNYARQIADSVIGTIEEQVRFANKIEVIEPSGEDPVQRLTGTNGSSRFHIPMEESTNLIDGLVYDEDYFMNHNIELSFALSTDKSYCMVSVAVTEEKGTGKQTVLTKTRAVVLSGEND